jgi:hypothetical protein
VASDTNTSFTLYKMVVLEIAAKALPPVVTVKVVPMLPLPKLSLVSSVKLPWPRLDH